MTIHRFLRRTALFSFLLLLLQTGSVRGASGLSLYIPSIPGDGTNNSIDVLSFSFGVSKVPSVNANWQDLNLMKVMDSASSPLMFNSAMGTTLNNVVFTYTDNNGKPAYTMTLNNVTVTSYQSAGSTGSGPPTESFSLHFLNIQWSYQKYDGAGNPVGPPVTHTWDVNAGSGT